jgi:hypothetical protein
MAGTVIVPWYATGFRADGFERDLVEVAAAALRYNATSYAVYRARDDRYKFQQLAAFDEHLDWERYWEGPELTVFRTTHSSWFQVPIVYGWWDLAVAGGVAPEGEGPGAGGYGNGAGNGRSTVGPPGESA